MTCLDLILKVLQSSFGRGAARFCSIDGALTREFTYLKIGLLPFHKRPLNPLVRYTLIE
jgi:hypothetical protein